MQKLRILREIYEKGIVAVVRAENSYEAKKIALACMKGGVNSIEITFTVPGAVGVIENLVQEFGDDLLVGAGTVLDSETARAALLAGAKYIVSPNFNLETARLCNRYQVPYMPGCMTLTEIVEAMEAGVDIIKLFPGSVFGPEVVRAIREPLPHVNIMPTNGVDMDNVGDWIESGCVAVGVSDDLTKGSIDEISAKAKEFRKIIKEARKNKKD